MSRPLKFYIFWNFLSLIPLILLADQGRSWQFLPNHFPFYILLVSSVIPLMVAYLAVSRFYGLKGLQKLKATVYPTELKGSAMTIASVPVLFLLAGIGLYPIFFDSFFSLKSFLKEHEIYTYFNVLVWFLPFIPMAISDAVGWRGFALPHFQSKYTAFGASVYIGLMNAVYVVLVSSIRQDIDLLFFLRITASSIFQSLLLTAAFNYSKGSVFPCLLFNLMYYFVIALDPVFLSLVAMVGYMLLSAYYINRYGRVHLGEGRRTKNFYKRALSVKETTDLLELDEEDGSEM